MRSLLVVIVSLAAAAAACDQREPTASAAPPPPVAAPVGEPPVMQPAAATSTATPPAPQDKNRWKGTYTTRRPKLETPDKVQDYTWKNDDGGAAMGSGELDLRFADDGTVRGEATGPLGAQLISGVFDGKVLRAAAMPKDPPRPGAMAGAMYAEMRGSKLVGTLRTSGSDGMVVREAQFELTTAATP